MNTLTQFQVIAFSFSVLTPLYACAPKRKIHTFYAIFISPDIRVPTNAFSTGVRPHKPTQTCYRVPQRTPHSPAFTPANTHACFCP